MMREEFAYGAAEAETELRERYPSAEVRERGTSGSRRSDKSEAALARQQAQLELEPGLDTSSLVPRDVSPGSSDNSTNDERGSQ
jgi:hypothetical protein